MEAMNNADRDVVRLFDDHFPQLCADLGLSVGAGDSRDLVWLGRGYIFRAVDQCVVVLHKIYRAPAALYTLGSGIYTCSDVGVCVCSSPYVCVCACPYVAVSVYQCVCATVYFSFCMLVCLCVCVCMCAFHWEINVSSALQYEFG
jgi:hypothetical protein